jgi:hypothetical protein
MRALIDSAVGQKGLTEDDRMRVADDTLRELRKYGAWRDLDDEVDDGPTVAPSARREPDKSEKPNSDWRPAENRRHLERALSLGPVKRPDGCVSPAASSKRLGPGWAFVPCHRNPDKPPG